MAITDLKYRTSRGTTQPEALGLTCCEQCGHFTPDGPVCLPCRDGAVRETQDQPDLIDKVI